MRIAILNKLDPTHYANLCRLWPRKKEMTSCELIKIPPDIALNYFFVYSVDQRHAAVANGKESCRPCDLWICAIHVAKL